VHVRKHGRTLWCAPTRSLTVSLSRRGGPLCPPDHTRRITSATWGVALHAPVNQRFHITYKLRQDKTFPGFFQSVPAAYGPAFHAAARLSSGMKRSGVLSTPTRSLSGTERGEGPFIHRTGNPRRRQASLFKNLYVRVLRPFPYRSSASSAAITPICPAQKMNIHRTRLA